MARMVVASALLLGTMMWLGAPAWAQGTGDEAAAPSGSTPATLYAHLDGFRDFALGPQLPDPGHAESVRYGLLSNTVSCLGDQPLADQDFHTLRGLSNTAPIVYGPEGVQSAPSYRLPYNVSLDAGAPMTFHWFLEVGPPGDAPAGGVGPVPSLSSAALVMPNVAVQATLRAGAQTSVDGADLDAGELIAQGLAVGTLAGDQTSASAGTVTYVGEAPSGRPLYDFELDMQLADLAVLPDAGFNLRVGVYLDNPYCSDPAQGTIMPNTVHQHTSAEHRPRLELAILQPIRLEYVHPQLVLEDLVIHAALDFAWGSADAGNLSVGVDGPDGPVEVEAIPRPVVHHHQGGQQEPVHSDWLVPGAALQPGAYTIRFDATNLQGTAALHETATFEVEGKDSAAAGAWLVVGLLGAATFVARRR